MNEPETFVEHPPELLRVFQWLEQFEVSVTKAQLPKFRQLKDNLLFEVAAILQRLDFAEHQQELAREQVLAALAAATDAINKLDPNQPLPDGFDAGTNEVIDDFQLVSPKG